MDQCYRTHTLQLSRAAVGEGEEWGRGRGESKGDKSVNV